MSKLKNIVIIFILCTTLNINAQKDYSFINEVITLYEKNNSIPKDTILLSNKFLDLKDSFKNLNKETIKIWWGINLYDTLEEKNTIPPVALFLKNFNLDRVSKKIKNTFNNDYIDKSRLKKHFYLCDDEYMENNLKKSFLHISRPYFNKKKDWCLIVKETNCAYFNFSTGETIYIYVKVDEEWELYNKITLSVS